MKYLDLYKTIKQLKCFYSNKCGYLSEYEKLANHIKKEHPDIEVKGREGRRGNFMSFYLFLMT